MISPTQRAKIWGSLLARAQSPPTMEAARSILIAGGYPFAKAGDAATVLYAHGAANFLPLPRGLRCLRTDAKTRALVEHQPTPAAYAKAHRQWVLNVAPDGTDLRFHRMAERLTT